MPRIARTIVACLPYHVTQRGNRREQVFFCDGDRRTYLRWLAEYARRNGVEVLAYCLMPNHVHLVVVPGERDSLQRTLKPLHMRYAQRINRERGWHGHLWQGRYFSSALDDDYFWAAIRYVERNPVRAGIVERAEHYSWSSAAAHCGLRNDPTLTREAGWLEAIRAVGDWSRWLAGIEDQDRIDMLRRNAGKGLPCGSDGFIRQLELLTGRDLHFRPQGGQPK